MLSARPLLVSLLALTLALATTSLPAAQSGSEAVVCVGSERRTLATNPVRRVYTGSYPRAWRAWSDPWDEHNPDPPRSSFRNPYPADDETVGISGEGLVYV